MAKKIIGSTGVVEIKSDAQKLAELTNKTPVSNVVPVIPTQPEVVAPTTPVVPTIPSDLQVAQARIAELEAKLATQAQPRTKRVFSAGVANAVPTCRKSTQRDGFVEFSFDQKPDEATRTQLKQAGYRWSKFNGVWYGPAITLANHERFGTLIQSALAA